MEKTKYIAFRLAIIAAASVLFGIVMYGLKVAGTYIGLESEHVIGGLIVAVALGIMIYWLSEDYELQKLKDK